MALAERPCLPRPVGYTYFEAAWGLRWSHWHVRRLVNQFRLPFISARGGRNFTRIVLLPPKTYKRLAAIKTSRDPRAIVLPPLPPPPGIDVENV